MCIPTLVLISLLGALIAWASRKGTRGDLEKIPGPRWNLLTALIQKGEDAKKNHLNIERLKKEYGPIVNVTQAGKTIIFLSDYETIYQVLVTRGKTFGGRSTGFITKELLQETGILTSYEPDNNWKLLRKVSQQHLRQFGDGLSRLESIISQVAEDMFDDFQANAGKAFDPKETIFNTALNSIAFLITGERTYTGDEIVENMQEYEYLLQKTQPIFAPAYFQLLEHIPVLKYLGFDSWKDYKRLVQLHNKIWQMLKDNMKQKPEVQSIAKLLLEHTASSDVNIKEADAKVSSLLLLFAGVTTTSTSFVSMVNILAHRHDVQKRLYADGKKIWEETGHAPTLKDRPDMPYTRAVVFELLRYTSVVAHGVEHRTREDTEIMGYKIPANTVLITSLWNLHHDESLWKDPYDFQPERYLDDDGQLVPADHPNRKHLLPFGAGVRVCLGESLALARLFLWLSTLVVRFEVSPAPGNLAEATDPRNYIYGGVLKPEPYEVIFTERI